MKTNIHQCLSKKKKKIKVVFNPLIYLVVYIYVLNIINIQINGILS